MDHVPVSVGLTPAAARLFRIRKTVVKMLGKRGYNVTDEDANMDPAEFVGKFGEFPRREAMNMLVGKLADPDDKLLVYFPEADVGVRECTPFIERLTSLKCSRGIMVVNGRFSNLAKSLLAEAGAIAIEHFRDDELLVDITEHELVPQHQVLSPEEKSALLARYKLRDSQLPRIQLGDPVARYYGMQRGQVVKIIRASETAGRYVTYRIVV